MVRTVLSMMVRAGCEPHFEQVWAAAAQAISQHPGNINQVLVRDASEHRRYLIFSDWADEESLRAFESSPTRRALSSALDELRESAEKTVCEVLTTIPARSEGKGHERASHL